MICHKKEEADQNDDDVCVLNFGEEVEEKTDKLLQKFNSDFLKEQDCKYTNQRSIDCKNNDERSPKSKEQDYKKVLFFI